MIELRPRPGVRLRRPATVSILVASGYPREVVPQVENADLVSARSKLEAKHLRYQIVYRLMPGGREPRRSVRSRRRVRSSTAGAGSASRSRAPTAG